ncbi:histidine kinase [Massilia sp. Dwa41.01b]|uniref:CHASE3 domain-containing protein n=1 Tax=unclassified Massilia TaxID=2609279 RepID=UPI001601ECEA|nr:MULTISPECIES: CHASE3 domain-containing protein [unclassified Massilia]QNA89390.1 histidine kinase [Massilia sp. Dwa41.01b]QNB00289.1 histidine kinase [Massilia sp. Se16.2.3]
MYFTSGPMPARQRALPWYKTLLCFACVLILVANGVSLLRNLEGLKAANSLQDQTTKVADELQHLNLLVTDAESNLRGYFLSGAPTYLSSVQGAPDQIDKQLRKVGTLLADNPAQLKNLAQLRLAVERQLGMMNQALAIYQDGGLREILAITGAAGEGEGDEIRMQVVIMLSEQNELLAARSAAFYAQYRHAAMLGLGINAAAIAVLLLFYRLVQRSFGARLDAEYALQQTNEQLETMVARRTEQLSVLSRHLIHVAEDEKSRLARELHDEMGANLTAIGIDLSSVSEQLRATRPDLVEMLARARATLVDTVQLKRRIVEDLRPSLLDNLGLSAALQSYCEDYARVTALDCDVLVDGDIDSVSPMHAIALFRIVQEALNNIAKYARAGSVIVHLALEDGALALEVSDDGVGIGDDALARTKSHGLLGMRERALLLGGKLEVGRGINGVGTCVRARIPVVASVAEAPPSKPPVPSPVVPATEDDDLAELAFSGLHPLAGGHIRS